MEAEVKVLFAFGSEGRRDILECVYPQIPDGHVWGVWEGLLKKYIAADEAEDTVVTYREEWMFNKV